MIPLMIPEEVQACSVKVFFMGNAPELLLEKVHAGFPAAFGVAHSSP